MKKLFALLLALAMTTQLALPAWAEGTEPSAPAARTEETTEPQTEEPTEAPTEQPTEEPTEATTEQPTEESTEAPTEASSEAPTEEPTEVQPEDPTEPSEEETSPAEAAETYRVTFRRTPEDLTLVVYPAAGDIDQAIDPEEDGSYLLATGEYGYLAAAEGYESVEGWFAVEDADTQVEVSLEVSQEEEITTVDNDGVVASGACGESVTWELTSDGLITILGSGAMWDYGNDYNDDDHLSPFAYGGKHWGRYEVKKLYISRNITHIGKNAFFACSYLNEITFEHKFNDALTIGEDAFSQNWNTSVPTTVRVPNRDMVNPAITSYAWNVYSYGGRIVTYEGTASLPMERITVETEDGGAEYELGIPVRFVAVTVPEDTIDEYCFEIVSEKTTADAVVTQNGVLSTFSIGIVTVRVYCIGKPEISSEISITILPPTGSLTGISVVVSGDHPAEAELGVPVKMQPVFTPSNAADRTVTWSVVEGSGSAEIDQSGILTPLRVGTVTVYATAANGTEGSCTVDIVRYAERITILLNGREDMDRLAAGEGAELSVILGPEDTTTSRVAWSVVSDSQNARVTCNYDSYAGPYIRLFALKPGKATLIATAEDSKHVIARKEITITEAVESYALPDGSGNLYFNRESGCITGADKTVKNVLIPAQIDGVTITGIAPYAFAKRDSQYGSVSDNTTLLSVSIPNTVTEIGAHAFDSCTAMSTLRFAPGSTLRVVGERAFDDCKSLNSLTLPDSIEQFGSGAFYGLEGLKSLSVSGEVDTNGWLGGSSDDYLALDTLTLTGRYVRGQKYINVDGVIWADGMPGREGTRNIIVSSGVESIEPYAFYQCYRLLQIALPETLTEIGEAAFGECQHLKNVQFPGSVKTLGKKCFKNCYQLQAIDLSQTADMVIGESAFEYCKSLENIQWPEKICAIGAMCFNNCNRLEEVDLSQIPDTITAKETKLTGKAVMPKVLVQATAGKADFEWAAYDPDDEGQYSYIAFIDGPYLRAADSGQVRLVCRDTYTGLQGSKIVTIARNTLIKPEDVTYLVSGGKVTLSAWAEPEDQKMDVYWVLGNGDEDYASITNNGVLTAKTVYEARQITVKACPYGSAGLGTKTLWILPLTTGMSLNLEDKPLDEQLDVDMLYAKTLNLSAQVQPAGALETVTWSSSAANVARVDANGVVTLVRPGKAVIKASSVDGSKVAAQVTLNVTYLDGSTKLTLTGDVPAQGLQPGQTARFTLRGSEEIAPENVIFTVPANMAAMGSVDETGLFTAGSKAGTVTVTAALRGDPLNRKASVRFKILPLQAEEMALSAQMPEGFGTLTEQAGEPLLILPKADVTANTTFPLTLLAKDYRGETMTPGVKWSSSDASIAAVDAKGNVTVKAGVSGQCAITAQATDMTKNSARFWISVRDYSPRLAESRLNLNTALAGGVSTALVESYGNTVEAVSIVNDDRFAVALEDNVLTLKASSDLPKGSYKLTLRAACADGRSYDYALEIKAAPALPKVTVKQTEKLNLFYRDSAAALTVTAPGCTVTDLSLTGTEDFALVWTEGQPRIVRTATETAKPNTRATLQIWLEGYTQPVTQNLTVSAGTTAPKLKLSAASSSLNTALNPEDLSAELWLLDSTNARLSLSGVSIREENGLAEISTHADSFTLTLQKPEKAKLTLLIQGDNWTQSVKLTHSVNVETKLSTLKSASAITLNSYFTQDSGKTEMILSQKNLVLQDVRFAPAARAGTAARTESDKLELTFDPEDNTVRASMADPENAAAAGNYSFTCIGVLADGTEIPGGTLKVTVAKTLPKARLSASAVRLNTVLAGEEQAEVTADLTGFSGCTLVGFRELDEAQYDGLDFADGKLTVRLADESAKSGTYKLTPIVRRDATGQLVTLPTSLTLKLTVYTSRKLGMSLTTKGKLDTLDPDSAVLYTVNKLTDCQGEITGLTLEGPDADRFQAELDTTGAKPQIRLTLREGETYATNVTYKFQFSLTVCGRQVLSPIQSLRVSQSGTKYTVPTGLVLYQSQTADLCARITLTAPQGAKIAGVTLNEKTPQAFLDAIGGEGGFTADCAGSEANLTFTAAAPGKLKPGVYTVLLDILPEGNAENVKPTTLRLTVKVMK